jgi:hypothetical protein
MNARKAGEIGLASGGELAAFTSIQLFCVACRASFVFSRPTVCGDAREPPRSVCIAIVVRRGPVVDDKN